jgi:hypothetical protein
VSCYDRWPADGALARVTQVGGVSLRLPFPPNQLGRSFGGGPFFDRSSVYTPGWLCKFRTVQESQQTRGTTSSRIFEVLCCRSATYGVIADAACACALSE